MNREEREKFVRGQVFASGPWEDAVQAIVNRWEEDAEQVRAEGLDDGAAGERIIHIEF